MSNQVTQLYRHYDAHGRLLYVGISLNAISRTAAHETAAPWFLEVVRIEIEHYPSRDESLRAEKSAIRRENPKYNVVHQPGPVLPRMKHAPISFTPDIPVAKNEAQPTSVKGAFSVNEWCALRKISRTEFYEMLKRGDGPRTYRVGRFQRISGEADRDWVAAREAVVA